MSGVMSASRLTLRQLQLLADAHHSDLVWCGVELWDELDDRALPAADVDALHELEQLGLVVAVSARPIPTPQGAEVLRHAREASMPLRRRRPELVGLAVIAVVLAVIVLVVLP